MILCRGLRAQCIVNRSNIVRLLVVVDNQRFTVLLELKTCQFWLKTVGFG